MYTVLANPIYRQHHEHFVNKVCWCTPALANASILNEA